MNGYNFMACILTINRMHHDSILLFKFGEEGTEQNIMKTEVYMK